jgi:hypothetical protein
MILVFLSSLVMAVGDQFRRMDALEWARLREGSILFVPFLTMIGLKFALVIGARTRRHASDGTTNPVPTDEELP